MTIVELITLLVAYLLVFHIPGYLCALAVGCSRSPNDIKTLLLSALIGVAAVTELAFIFSLIFGFSFGVVASATLLTSVAAAFWYLRNGSRDKKRSVPDTIGTSWVLLLLAIGVMIGFTQLIITVDGASFYPDSMRDYFVRIEVIQGMLDSGVPPVNTFSAVGPRHVLCYQYLFYFSCAILSLVTKLSAVKIWAFFVAFSALSFFTCAFVFARNFFQSRKVAFLALGMSLCGGFDVPVTIAQFFVTKLRLKQTAALPTSAFELDFWAGTPHVPLFLRNVFGAPHHLLSLALFLGVCLLMNEMKERDRFRKISLGLLIAYMFSCSLHAGMTFALAFLVLAIFMALHRRWKEFVSLVQVGCAAVAILCPYLLPIVLRSKETQGFIGLRPIETYFGGAILQHYFGVSFLTKLLDLPLHFLLEFGISLPLAILGLRLLDRDMRRSTLGILVIASALSSFAFILFIRSPGESFALNGVLALNFAIFLFAAFWLERSYFQLKSPAFKAVIAGSLFIQGSASLYFIALMGGYRFTQPNVARGYFEEERVIREMDSYIDKSHYRLQVLPAGSNLDNMSLSSRIPVFSKKAQVMYVSDGALYYGMDRERMEQYFAKLCAVYQGNSDELKKDLAAFNPKLASQDAPWFYYMNRVRQCLWESRGFSSGALLDFVNEFNVDYVLLQQDEKLSESFNKSSLPIRKIPLSGGYTLLAFDGPSKIIREDNGNLNF